MAFSSGHSWTIHLDIGNGPSNHKINRQAMTTQIGHRISELWDAFMSSGEIKCRIQPEIYIELRKEVSTRGGASHTAVLINAHVKMKGRGYLLPTQMPLSSATPEECESLVLEMIERLRKVARTYKENEDLKVEGYN